MRRPKYQSDQPLAPAQGGGAFLFAVQWSVSFFAFDISPQISRQATRGRARAHPCSWRCIPMRDGDKQTGRLRDEARQVRHSSDSQRGLALRPEQRPNCGRRAVGALYEERRFGPGPCSGLCNSVCLRTPASCQERARRGKRASRREVVGLSQGTLRNVPGRRYRQRESPECHSGRAALFADKRPPARMFVARIKRVSAQTVAQPQIPQVPGISCISPVAPLGETARISPRLSMRMTSLSTTPGYQTARRLGDPCGEGSACTMRPARSPAPRRH